MDEQPIRKKNRLDGYDYTKCGAYFVTICTQNHAQLFWTKRATPPQIPSAQTPIPQTSPSHKPVGAIIGRPRIPYKLTEIGMQVEKSIGQIGEVYENVRVDYYCVMPDHVHILLSILPPKEWFENNDGRLVIAPTDIKSFNGWKDGNKSTPSLSTIIQQFKGSVTKQISRPIWQRSFYESIIRTKLHYVAARDYIASNPIRWEHDHGDPSDYENWLLSRT